MLNLMITLICGCLGDGLVKYIGHALVVAFGTIPPFDRFALVGDCLALVRYGWNKSIRTFPNLYSSKKMFFGIYINIGALLTTPKTNTSPENSGWKPTFLLKWFLFR